MEARGTHVIISCFPTFFPRCTLLNHHSDTSVIVVGSRHSTWRPVSRTHDPLIPSNSLHFPAIRLEELGLTSTKEAKPTSLDFVLYSGSRRTDGWTYRHSQSTHYEGGSFVQCSLFAEDASGKSVWHNVQSNTCAHRSKGTEAKASRPVDAHLLPTHGQPPLAREACSFARSLEGYSRDTTGEGRRTQEDARKGPTKEGRGSKSGNEGQEEVKVYSPLITSMTQHSQFHFRLPGMSKNQQHAPSGSCWLYFIREARHATIGWLTLGAHRAIPRLNLIACLPLFVLLQSVMDQSERAVGAPALRVMLTGRRTEKSGEHIFPHLQYHGKRGRGATLFSR